MSVLTIAYDKEHNLPYGERDRTLLRTWPNVSVSEAGWEDPAELGFPRRELAVDPPPRESGLAAEPTELEEAILRFPSAPVFATHEARQRPFKLGREESWPNFHSMRVLRRKERPEGPANHVFLLHNGLNETRDVSFYYRLAAWILAERQDAACILRPLPGHFGRHFFQSPFTELPLDEYLQDPASLFRQFLRYMQETQWLLSALVPRADYPVRTGCELLLHEDERGRLDPDALGEEICRQANHALEESKERSKAQQRKRGEAPEEGDDEEDSSYSHMELPKDDVIECVKQLRGYLEWAPLSGEPGSVNRVDHPAIHAVGYSMGGFVAQSVFFTWPYAVASCSSLFAGGALRDLAPTSFAHPEEWQSVLHGLRAELDHARSKGHLTPTETDQPDEERYAVGIKRRTFEYFERVFEGVFLQTHRGSYSTRLGEFSRRMLFVLGGEDPIVRTRNVLDAAPPGGITLHQIGDLGHFQDSKHKPLAEQEQRAHWLPEAGGTIGRFAERAAELLQKSHARYWERTPGAQPVTWKRDADGALSNMPFEDELDAMIDMVTRGGGWLLIGRNQIPTVFLDEESFNSRAAGMHHSEELIGYYTKGLEDRVSRLHELEEGKSGFTLLIPSQQVLKEKGSDLIKARDTNRERAMYAKSEVAIRYWPDDHTRPEAWNHFATSWCRDGAVRQFEPGEYDPSRFGSLGAAWHGRHGGGADDIAVLVLPDVWFAFDKDACAQLLKFDLEKADNPRQKAERGAVDLASRLAAKEEMDVEWFKQAQARGGIRAVKVSPAEFNPRYRGRLLDGASPETSGADRLLIHWALAYAVSTPVSAGTISS